MQKAPFDVLSELLVEQFGVDASIIHQDAVLTELGLDSLTLMEFIFAAEDAMNLRIPEEKMDLTQAGLTLGQICDVISDMKKS